MFELLGSAITLVCAQDSFGTFLTTDSLPSVLCANFVNIAGKFTELDGRFLVVALAIPFAASLAKQSLVAAEETQYCSVACTERPAQNRGKRWKPHDKLRSVWPAIFALVGLASWLVYRKGGLIQQRDPLGRYVCLLAANLLCWPPVFFGGHSRRFACLDTAVLLLSSLLTIPKFYEVSPAAGLLLLPYLGWTCFASTLINCSFLSSNAKVVEQAQRLSAFKHGSHPEAQATDTGRPAAAEPGVAEGLPRTQAPCGAAGNRSILSVDFPPLQTTDAATSPFSEAGANLKSPLAQAKELLSKMTESLAAPDLPDPPSNEYIRASIQRVNSLLSAVSTSIQGASAVLTEGKASGPLARMGSLISRVSLSLNRGPSEELEQAKWPCSDSIPSQFFSCPGAAGYKVRGPAYFTDKKKIGPENCVAKLVSLNLVSLKEPTFHIARFLPSIRDSKAPFIFVWQVMVPGRTHISLAVAWALDHDPVAAVQAAANRIPEEESVDLHVGDPVAAPESTSGHSTPNQQGPSPGGTPPTSVRKLRAAEEDLSVEPSSLSMSALEAKKRRDEKHRRTASTVDMAEVAARRSREGSASSLREQVVASSMPAPQGADPFDVAMARFLDESGTEKDIKARRHGMFKIIPRIEKGGWVVKQAVGQNTPVLLGKKLTTQYHRGPRYIEVDVDVGSSRSAASVVGLVQGALKSLVIDIAVLLEGKTQEELPESLLGTIRLEHLDLSKAAVLDTATGTIVRKE